MDNRNDILVHHGIKGMKWGVRRTPEELGYSTRGERKAAKQEAAVLRKASVQFDGKDKFKARDEYFQKEADIYMTSKAAQKTVDRLTNSRIRKMQRAGRMGEATPEAVAKVRKETEKAVRDARFVTKKYHTVGISVGVGLLTPPIVSVPVAVALNLGMNYAGRKREQKRGTI